MDISKINFEPLIEKARVSESGLAELLSTIQPYVINKSRAVLSSYEDAEDIYQIISLRLYNNLDNIDPNGFMSYLKTAVTNACNDELRKRHKLTDDGEEINTFSIDAFEDYEIPDDYDNRIDLLDEYRNKIVFEVIDTLPDKQKEVIALRYIDDQKIKDIAAQLGVNENTVKTRLYSAYDNIKDEVLRIQDRDGIKLYSYSPVMFFLLLLRRFGVSETSVNNNLVDEVLKSIKDNGNVETVNNLNNTNINSNMTDNVPSTADSIKDTVEKTFAGNSINNNSTSDNSENIGFNNNIQNNGSRLLEDDLVINNTIPLNTGSRLLEDDIVRNDINVQPISSNSSDNFNFDYKPDSFNSNTNIDNEHNIDSNQFSGSKLLEDDLVRNSTDNKQVPNNEPRIDKAVKTTVATGETLAKVGLPITTKLLLGIVGALIVVTSVFTISNNIKKNSDNNNSAALINNTTDETKSELLNYLNLDYLSKGYQYIINEYITCNGSYDINNNNINDFRSFLNSACEIKTYDTDLIEYVYGGIPYVSTQQHSYSLVYSDEENMFYTTFEGKDDGLLTLKYDESANKYYFYEKYRDFIDQHMLYQTDPKIYFDNDMFNFNLGIINYIDVYGLACIDEAVFNNNRMSKVLGTFQGRAEYTLTYKDDKVYQVICENFDNPNYSTTYTWLFDEEGLLRYVIEKNNATGNITYRGYRYSESRYILPTEEEIKQKEEKENQLASILNNVHRLKFVDLGYEKILCEQKKGHSFEYPCNDPINLNANYDVVENNIESGCEFYYDDETEIGVDRFGFFKNKSEIHFAEDYSEFYTASYIIDGHGGAEVYEKLVVFKLDYSTGMYYLEGSEEYGNGQKLYFNDNLFQILFITNNYASNLSFVWFNYQTIGYLKNSNVEYDSMGRITKLRDSVINYDGDKISEIIITDKDGDIFVYKCYYNNEGLLAYQVCLDDANHVLSTVKYQYR